MTFLILEPYKVRIFVLKQDWAFYWPSAEQEGPKDTDLQSSDLIL